MNSEQIAAARDWILECDFPNLKDIDIEEMSDLEIVSAVKRYYDGGVQAFISDIVA